MKLILTLGAASALAVIAHQASAATCTVLTGSVTCDAPASAPVAVGADNTLVTVTATGGIASADRNTAPVVVTGDHVEVLNNGAIAQSDTRNNGYAIEVRGETTRIHNAAGATISSGDRAIEVLEGAGGLIVNNSGTITARRQAVRSLEGFENAAVYNYGTISSQNGRALQLRGDGARVYNYGTLTGGEEVVEGRGNFFVENRGDITINDPAIEDEDGVQFASGTAINYGLIRGSDDGIDIDEGYVGNYGSLISTGPDSLRDAGGIDVDAEYDDGVSPIRPAGNLLIRNEGLIEGPRGIVTAEGSTSQMTIHNQGTLRGRSGKAVEFAATQGDSRIDIAGNSQIFGDVLFGGGNDVFALGFLTSGAVQSGRVDGGLGTNTVDLNSFFLADLVRFSVIGDVIETTLRLDDRVTLFGAAFTNFGFWTLEGRTYTTDELQAAVAPVPLPAGLPLMAVGLGALALMRRRKARS